MSKNVTITRSEYRNLIASRSILMLISYLIYGETDRENGPHYINSDRYLEILDYYTKTYKDSV